MGERSKRRSRGRHAAPAATGRLKSRVTARVAAISLLLAAGTVVLYSPVRRDAFITYDDYDYVLNNPHVAGGLNWQTVQWSLTSIEQANWHPITWMSHALDCQLLGLNAGYHHLTNVAFHCLNVVLLFLLLWRATGAIGRSFAVAALFAWHPFNVQSVAWVAERKNLLSTFFLLVALAAYGWYALRPRANRLLVLIGVFILALASKPMAVTLPFLLLLLDYWPLQRVQGWRGTALLSHQVLQQPIRQLLVEKLPLFVLSAASCAITVWAQRAEGTLQSLQETSFRMRLENSLHAYVMYIRKTFWPSGFAVFYPHPGPSLSLWKPIVALVLLCAISALVWRQRTIRPYLIVGWLWFVGSLVPVIGLVQVGDQAMADRYAYLPLIGIFVMVVWSVADFLDARHVTTAPRWALVFVVLGVLSFLTLQQISYWENSQTVWTQALDVSKGDPLVEKKFGNALVVLGDPDAAMPHLIKAERSYPDDTVLRVNLGMCFLARGRVQEAIQEFDEAVKLTNGNDPNQSGRQFRSSAFVDLGIAYTLAKDYPKALTSFRGANQADASRVDDVMQRIAKALASTPAESDFLTFSLLLRARGKDSEATSILQNAITVNPEYASARELLSYFNAKGK